MSVGDAFGNGIMMMFVMLCVSVPLGLWKLIEIIVWVIKHITITVK